MSMPNHLKIPYGAPMPHMCMDYYTNTIQKLLMRILLRLCGKILKKSESAYSNIGPSSQRGVLVELQNINVIILNKTAMAERFLLKRLIPLRIDNLKFCAATNDQKCLGQTLSKIDGSQDKSQLFQST